MYQHTPYFQKGFLECFINYFSFQFLSLQFFYVAENIHFRNSSLLGVPWLSFCIFTSCIYLFFARKSLSKSSLGHLFLSFALKSIQGQKLIFVYHFFIKFERKFYTTTVLYKKCVNFFYKCLVLVIWTEHQMSKLVLNVKYFLLLSFLTAVKFYNLGQT